MQFCITGKLALFALACIAMNTKADILSVHCPIGCPSSPSGNDLVFSHVYALSNNPTTKFADWVAYEVNILNFGVSPSRNWASDPLLDEATTLEMQDYKKANSVLDIDRGHQAPLASFAGSRYWYELNYLSNITPQAGDLNQGPWKNLEEAVRKGVNYRNSLFVVTGPVYKQAMKQLPKADEPHIIPSGFFKIIYEPNGNAAGFIMGQDTPRKFDYCEKRFPISSIRESVAFVFPVFKESESVLRRLGC